MRALFADPPLTGTRFQFSAANLSRSERLAEVDEMRILIRDLVNETLVTVPNVLVLDPHKTTREYVASLLRASDAAPDVQLFEYPETIRMRRLRDVWLAVVAVDVQQYDPVAVVASLSREFGYALVVGRTGQTTVTPRHDLHHFGLTILLDESQLDDVLPLLKCAIAERRTLPERVEAELLTRQIVHRFGADTLHEVGLQRPYTTCPTMVEAERALLKRALVAAKGSRAHAAKLLGLAKSTFYIRLNEHNLKGYCKG